MKLEVIRCPNCGGELQIGEYQFNTNVTCKHCASLLRVAAEKESAEYWISSCGSSPEEAFYRMCTMKETLRGLENKSKIIQQTLFFIPYFRVDAGIVQIRKGKTSVGNILRHFSANKFSPSSPVHGMKFDITGRYSPDELLTAPPLKGTTVIPDSTADPEALASHAMLKPPDSEFTALFSTCVETVFYPFWITEFSYGGRRHTLISDGRNMDPVKFSAPASRGFPLYLTSFTAVFGGLILGFFTRFAIFLKPEISLILIALLLPLSYILMAKLSEWLAWYLAESGNTQFNGREFHE